MSNAEWSTRVLRSGWSVHPDNSLYFTSPHGFTYIRNGLDINSQTRHSTEPDTLPLSSIFTPAEYEEWRSNFVV